MKITTCFISALVLVLGMTSPTWAKDKKHGGQRAMLERMEAVPCGAKQNGITGVGSIFASAGLTHLSSEEKLCQQYLLRSDDMEYHIRPVDTKHTLLLPVGQEAVYKIKKSRLYLRMADSDMKAREFHVVAMTPLNTEPETAASAHHAQDKPMESRQQDKPVQPTRPSKPANADNTTVQPPPPGPGC